MRPSRMRTAGLLAAVVAAALLAAAPARADTVTDWNVHATDALITVAAQAPTVSTIHLGMVHGAVYDAVNADRPQVRAPFRSAAGPIGFEDAAAATAAYRVLVHLVPAQKTTPDGHYAASLAAIADGPEKQGGIAVGEAAAWAMIAARTGDGRFGAPGFTVGENPGDWRPVPPGLGNDPNAGLRRSRAVPGQERPRSSPRGGPYDLDSRRYAREFEEVKTLGSLMSSTVARIRRTRPSSGPRVR